MNDVKIIVFDLDGTLYDDVVHFRYYADLLKDYVAEDKQEQFEADYNAVLKGQHSLKIGRAYDAKRDLILSHLNGVVQKAYNWNGEEIPTEDVTTFYPEAIPFDLTSIISIGDLWWVPVTIARHYGVTSEEAYACFMQTREHMMTEEFQLNPHEQFREVLQSLHKKYTLVLLTNSPQSDSDVIIEKLGFTSYFQEKFFEAQKPIKTKVRFSYIAEKFDVSYEEILSIGDNYINEIFPAVELGCKTIYIDAHGAGAGDSHTTTVSNLTELSKVLREKLL
ncbi:HAD family hydrolase [Sutcliffiella cohnii]|uniref:HAD family hydrolase n=1 Tax=Sutcliffiella cohnii TaxID=33932 RepID=UPI002E23A616|nr:HAD family hydrolase [Sutcliffiella cohnii]